MSRHGLAVLIGGVLIGAGGTYWALSMVIDDLTVSLAYYQNENARYTDTVNGLVNLGWSEARIQSYIDRGCVPYLEYVKEPK